MGKRTAQIYESGKRVGDVVGEWGAVILIAPHPNPLPMGEGYILSIIF